MATASKREEGPKRTTSPQVEAIHSKQPIREKDFSPKYTLAQFHKLQTKELFNVSELWECVFLACVIFQWFFSCFWVIDCHILLLKTSKAISTIGSHVPCFLAFWMGILLLRKMIFNVILIMFSGAFQQYLVYQVQKIRLQVTFIHFRHMETLEA